MLSLHTPRIILLTFVALGFGYWGITLTATAEDQATKAEQTANFALQTGQQMQQSSTPPCAAHRHRMGVQEGYPEQGGCPKAQALKSSHAGGRQMMAGMKSGHGGRRCKGAMGDQGMMGAGMMRGMMSDTMGGPGCMNEATALPGCRREPRSCPMGAGWRMIADLEELDLTPEQWSRVRTLAQEKLGRMADLWARQMNLRIEVAGLQWSGNLDAQRVKDAFMKEAEARAEMVLAGIEYTRGLKEILTPEQLEEIEFQCPKRAANDPGDR